MKWQLVNKKKWETATFAVLVCELEGLHESQGFVDRAADGKIIDGYLTKVAVLVDQEQATESDALILLSTKNTNSNAFKLTILAFKFECI